MKRRLESGDGDIQIIQHQNYVGFIPLSRRGKKWLRRQPLIFDETNHPPGRTIPTSYNIFLSRGGVFYVVVGADCLNLISLADHEGITLVGRPS